MTADRTTPEVAVTLTDEEREALTMATCDATDAEDVVARLFDGREPPVIEAVHRILRTRLAAQAAPAPAPDLKSEVADLLQAWRETCTVMGLRWRDADAAAFVTEGIAHHFAPREGS